MLHLQTRTHVSMSLSLLWYTRGRFIRAPVTLSWLEDNITKNNKKNHTKRKIESPCARHEFDVCCSDWRVSQRSMKSSIVTSTGIIRNSFLKLLSNPRVYAMCVRVYECKSGSTVWNTYNANPRADHGTVNLPSTKRRFPVVRQPTCTHIFVYMYLYTYTYIYYDGWKTRSIVSPRLCERGREKERCFLSLLGLFFFFLFLFQFNRVEFLPSSISLSYRRIQMSRDNILFVMCRGEKARWFSVNHVDRVTTAMSRIARRRNEARAKKTEENRRGKSSTEDIGFRDDTRQIQWHTRLVFLSCFIILTQKLHTPRIRMARCAPPTFTDSRMLLSRRILHRLYRQQVTPIHLMYLLRRNHSRKSSFAGFTIFRDSWSFFLATTFFFLYSLNPSSRLTTCRDNDFAKPEHSTPDALSEPTKTVYTIGWKRSALR